MLFLGIPDPERPVTASIQFSVTSKQSPTELRTFVTTATSSIVAKSDGEKHEAEAAAKQQILGMTRIIRQSLPMTWEITSDVFSFRNHNMQL